MHSLPAVMIQLYMGSSIARYHEQHYRSPAIVACMPVRSNKLVEQHAYSMYMYAMLINNKMRRLHASLTYF